MMRPESVDITEVVERTETGDLYIWVRGLGQTICILVPHLAIDIRKLVYGHAHLMVDRLTRVKTIVDDVPDATERALLDIIAEHFDRFDDTGEDWRGHEPPDADGYSGPGWTRRASLERAAVPLPLRAPEIGVPSVTRF